jgi:hypothetical protein
VLGIAERRRGRGIAGGGDGRSEHVRVTYPDSGVFAPALEPRGAKRSVTQGRGLMGAQAEPEGVEIHKCGVETINTVLFALFHNTPGFRLLP